MYQRVTRSMRVDPESNTIVSKRQPCKTEDQEVTLRSPSETSTPSLNPHSRFQSPYESFSEEAEADSNILIKMEEVKELLEGLSQ